LEKRIKLLELYTLHVLPRNEEWDYAREFISMSEVLDDERKEAFLLALHGLREEKEDTEKREEKLRQQQQEQMEERRREMEAKARAEADQQKKEDENRQPPCNPSSDLDAYRHPQPTPPSRTSRTPATKKPVTPPPNFYIRASMMFANIQKSISQTAHQMTANPMAFFRTLLFLLAFGLAFGRRDLRERVLGIMRRAWEKVRRTVGMGVKVSYI
jgi:hypothetical protein